MILTLDIVDMIGRSSLTASCGDVENFRGGGVGFRWWPEKLRAAKGVLSLDVGDEVVVGGRGCGVEWC